MTRLSDRGSGRRPALAIALCMLAGCTSVPAPVQEVAGAERAVQAAGAADAASLAPAELEKARGKLEAARRALAAREHARARQLAEQAVVDAELARITAGAEQAAQTAAGIRAQIGDATEPAMQDMGS
jgi:hypothetical protein